MLVSHFSAPRGMQADHHQFYAGWFPVTFTFICIQFPRCFLQFLVRRLSEATNISTEIANSEERTTDMHEKIIGILYILGFPRSIVTLGSAETPQHYSEHIIPAPSRKAAVLCSSCHAYFSPCPPQQLLGATTTICVIAQARYRYSCKTTQEEKFSLQFTLVA